MIKPMPPATTRSTQELCRNNAAMLARGKSVTGIVPSLCAPGIGRAQRAQTAKAFAQIELALDHAVGDGIGGTQARQVHVAGRQPHHLGSLRDTLLTLRRISRRNDDGGGAGPHIGGQSEASCRPGHGHFQAGRGGAVLMQTPRQLQQKCDARLQLGSGQWLAARHARVHAAARTCSVVPSTATTSTVAPNGRSGPLTSH